MEDLTICEGWFKSGDESIAPRIFCEHKAKTTTLDYEIGIEYCNYCGALAHYNIDTDKLEWKLPEHLTKQNYN